MGTKERENVKQKTRSPENRDKRRNGDCKRCSEKGHSDKQQVLEPPGCSSKTSMTNTESEEDEIQSDTSSDELFNVHEEPHMITQSELNDLISMQCAATGDRPPQFVWERDGVTVSSNTDPRVRVEDGGLYACIAKEGEHVASSENRLDFYAAPKWLEEPSNSSLLLGRKGIVSCSASGYPQPQVHWMKKDALLGTWQPVLELAGGGILSLPNGSLVIEEVSLTDEGLYSRYVENGVGTPLSKTVWMTVNTYSLTWKEASGPWQEVWSPNKVPNKLSNLSGVQKHALTGLKCDTKYSLRITATNKVGTSQPAYLDVSTFPRQSYTGHLYQYRGSFALSGLSAGTWYVLRVTATNEAGSVTTVYNYATKNEDGSEVGPPSEIFDINMLVIVLSSILLAVCLICCVYILVKRQRNVNLTGYRDSITVDKSGNGNTTHHTVT
ncbi:unnamed protein product [Danaus chrysippus]|uniref:(African queen) hypothetical protein n=1 Tax=Danaus chrysippus TaxID=151541 RepID=A0A8J2QBC6_9NEOP|nr:unnamed protein product [Danaus chrysippus]